MKRNGVQVIWLMLLLVHFGWSKEGTLKVVVPIEPYRYIVEQLAGDHVEVSSLVSGNMDPHQLTITGKQMRFVAHAELYIEVGLAFEGHVMEQAVSNHRLNVLSLGVAEGSATSCTDDHDHDHGHDHGQADKVAIEPHVHDPHLWTNPRELTRQIRVIGARMIELRPQLADEIDAGVNVFCDRLASLDKEMIRSIESSDCKRLLVYHPAWGSFCDAYGLEQVAVEREGKPLRAREMVQLMKGMDGSFFPFLVVQPQRYSKNIEILAEEMGMMVVQIDPLAYDYFETLEKLKSAFDSVP